MKRYGNIPTINYTGLTTNERCMLKCNFLNSDCSSYSVKDNTCSFFKYKPDITLLQQRYKRGGLTTYLKNSNTNYTEVPDTYYNNTWKQIQFNNHDDNYKKSKCVYDCTKNKDCIACTYSTNPAFLNKNSDFPECQLFKTTMGDGNTDYKPNIIINPKKKASSSDPWPKGSLFYADDSVTYFKT